MLAIGHVLQNRYNVIAPLGHGGMGAAYRVRDTRLNIDRVLKEMIIAPEMGEDVARLIRQFQREAESLATLHHSNLPGVQDYFFEDNNYYLVMDFIEGYGLETLIHPGGLPEATVLNYADQLLGVLEYIHGKGILHRDIKPSNIIIQPDGRCVLVDFGLVKTVTPTSPETRTLLAGVGTPEYAPPEQTFGGTDQRSDLFSLAATLYHALTGQFPIETGMRSAGVRMPGIRELNPQVSENTESVVLRAFSLDRTARFNSAAEMRAALGQPGPLRPPSRPPSSPLQTRVVPMDQTRPPSTPMPTRVAQIEALPIPPQAAPAPAKGTNRIVIIAIVGVVVAALIVMTGLALVVRGVLNASRTPIAIATEGESAGGRPTVTLDVSTNSPETPLPTARTAPTRPATNTPKPAPTQGNNLLLTLAPGVEMDLVAVPAGDFVMGSADTDSTAQDNEKPLQKLALDEFLIGKYEVTNAQFAAFVDATGHQTTAEAEGTGVIFASKEWTDTVGVDWRHPMGPKTSINGKDNNPVAQISWDDAVAFCQWASEVTGRDVRLPTEAEWEKAARGTDARPYPWGMQAISKSHLNFNDNAGADTTPVGSYSPLGDSPYGAADMAGNVWEWTSSLYLAYPYDPGDGREDMSSRKARVLRGGSYYNDSKNVRSAYRLNLYPDYRYTASGFRVAVGPLSKTDIFGKVQTPTPASGVLPNTTGAALSVLLAPGVTMDFARVPAGPFLMGSAESDKDAGAYEKPQHKVTLDEFLIGQTLVTNAQFSAFVKASGYKTTAEQKGSGIAYNGKTWVDTKGANWLHPRGPASTIDGKGDYPVVQISMDDAVAFCEWAGKATGQNMQLPTEAQWEKAARGTDGALYPWGNTPPNPSHANYNMDKGDTTPVGEYSPQGDSPYGLADMAGNTWEWTSTIYKAYPYDATDGREDAASREVRVLRGGAYYFEAKFMRSAGRATDKPDTHNDLDGFRVVVMP